MKQTFSALAITGLTIGLTGCSSIGEGVASTASLQPHAPNGRVATLIGPGELSPASLPPSLRAMDPRRNMPQGHYPQVAYRPQYPASQPTSRPYLQPDMGAQEAAFMGQMAVDDVAPASGVSDYCPPQSYPIVPRVELPLIQGVERAATSAELFPDEYICDGGDEGFPTAVRDDGSVVLQFEETVGTFLDDHSERHIEPSTRVCVYAPAFGAVTTISRPVVEQIVGKVAGTHDHVGLVGYAAPIGPRIGEQTDTGHQTRMRSRPTEVDGQRVDANVGSVTQVEKHQRTLNVLQEFNFIGDKSLDGTTIAILNEGIDAAVAWQRNEAPIIAGRGETLVEVTGSTSLQEYLVVEDRRQEGELRLVKTADVSSAQPGEEVKFVIRYDNQGGKPVFDVTIVDHLSPRLELVESSVQCDDQCEVIIEDDYEGSVYLKVRLSEALESKSGGVVTFTCRVR